MNTHYKARLIAAQVLKKLINEINLRAKAIAFDPNRPNEWIVHHEGHVTALNNGHKAADIWIEEQSVQIMINSWFDIIRSEHLSDFNPEENDPVLIVKTSYDPVTLVKHDDCEAIIELPEVQEVYNMGVPYHRETRYKRLKVNY